MTLLVERLVPEFGGVEYLDLTENQGNILNRCAVGSHEHLGLLFIGILRTSVLEPAAG